MTTTDDATAAPAPEPAPPPANDRAGTATIVAGVILLSVLVAAVTGLTLANRDPGQLLYFASGSILPFAALILVGKRLDGLRQTAAANNDGLQQIGQAVNGKLDAKFAELHQRLDGLGAPTSPALAGGVSQALRDQLPPPDPAAGRHEAPPPASTP
jgi:hypothetical protein